MFRGEISMGTLHSKTDVVYLYKPNKTGELFWSIKSLKNIEHQNVYIVRDTKHDWAGYSKYHNQIAKLLDVCNNDDVSEDFIMFNDDFYVMDKWTPINYNRGLLSDHIQQRNKRDTYSRSLIQTDLYLTGRNYKSLSYELHTPFIFNKTKLKSLIENLPQIRSLWLQIRSLYGNIYNVKTEYMPDVKNPMEYTDKILLSSSDTTIKLGLGQFIRSELLR